jgi:catechol-2,3-dioxygenase
VQIRDVHLQTRHLNEQKKFYTHTLGLSLVHETANAFTLQIGTTQLTFQGVTLEDTLYHIAFTIPRNQFEQAKRWLQGRAEMLVQGDEDEFFSASWNVHSLYFEDAAGHILEFIARHDLANDTQSDFGPTDFLCISEVGLVVQDVAAHVALLKERLGLDIYKHSVSDTFAAVGDVHGLFILAQIERPWYPTTTAIARVSPLQVTIQGQREQRYDIAQYPYTIRVTASS